MTPGAFLRAAREAVGLTLLDVALRTETTPPVSASARARLIGAIEDDLVLPCAADLVVLHAIYRFDWQSLEEGVDGTNILSQPVLRRAA